MYLGHLYFEKDMLKKSLLSYEQSIKLKDRESIDGIRNIAYHYFNKKEYKKALSCYELILKYAPNDVKAREDVKEVEGLIIEQ